MKIVCDACQAKYSISDDKVQGKVFKIRCKKCSNIIVVRGGAAAAEPAAAPAQEKEHRVYDYGYEAGDQAPAGDDAVWHVVINQDQVGPMTAADVQQRFQAGEIDAETYAWREGFADWMPLAQVDAFAAMVASGSTTAAIPPRGGSGAEAIGAMFAAGATSDEAGTVRSDPGDLFAAAAAGAAARGDDDGGDLFGSKPAARGAPAAAQASQAKLRGERNENSVLFSLNNLAQLASDRPAPIQAQAPSSSSASSGNAPVGHATGAAGGEGSGLIDIRSMASAYLGGQQGAAKAAGTSSAIGSIDDLPVFGGGGFSEPAVIVPTARPANNNKLLYALIGSVALLAVAAVILVIVMVKGKGGDSNKSEGDKLAASVNPDKPDKGSDKTDTGSGSDSAAKPDSDSGSASTATTPEAPKPTNPTTTTTTTPDPKKDKPKPTTSTPPKTTTSGVGVARNDRTTPKQTTPPPPPPPKETGGDSSTCDEVSCVLNNYEGACCSKFRKGGSKPTGGSTTTTSGGSKPGSDLPSGLDRSMISEGVSRVKARVQSCGDKSNAKGSVKVSVKVTPDGGVSSVSVKESPDQSLGNCVAGAMKGATFKKTQTGGSFSIPFQF